MMYVAHCGVGAMSAGGGRSQKAVGKPISGPLLCC